MEEYNANYRNWYYSCISGLSGLLVKLETLRPSQQHRKEELLQRLEAVSAAMRSLPLEDFCRDALRPPEGSTLRQYKDLSADIGDAWDPRIETADLREGVLYRVRCRNSNCGIWFPDRGVFQIARNKFGNEYLFEEFLWGGSGSYCTARAYEILEALPPFRDNTERLAYLVAWREKLGGY